jgi:ketosteroid isomerase-like protein
LAANPSSPFERDVSRRRIFILWAAVATCGSVPARNALASPADDPSVAAVRQARDAFNAAILKRDSTAIGAFLASSYHIVTGRSDQFHGGKEEETEWARRFRTDPTMTYRRMTRDVAVNESWGLAQETGEWSGTYTVSSHRVVASGVYAAKWQRTEKGRWLLQAEVFTTLKCDGPESGCVKPLPIDR